MERIDRLRHFLVEINRVQFLAGEGGATGVLVYPRALRQAHNSAHSNHSWMRRENHRMGSAGLPVEAGGSSSACHQEGRGACYER